MKIISKHKDYYDWAVSIYGIDEVMVYDRRTDSLEKSSDDIDNGLNGPSITTHVFSICNNFYTVYQFKNKFYHTVDDLMELNKVLKKEKVDHYFLRGRYSWRYDNQGDRKVAELKFKENNKASNVNREIRQPVLIQTTYRDASFKFTAQKENATFFDSSKKVQSYWRIPDLSTYGFAKWYPSEEMFQNVYAFISWTKDNPEIPNKQSNDEKINSHGFDTKHSFRPNMKNDG